VDDVIVLASEASNILDDAKMKQIKNYKHNDELLGLKTNKEV